MVYVIIKNTINKKQFVSKNIFQFNTNDCEKEFFIYYGNSTFNTIKEAHEFCAKFALNLVELNFVDGILKCNPIYKNYDKILQNGNTITYCTQYAINVFYNIIQIDDIINNNIKINNHLQYLEEIVCN
jgi:hypothetical protein